ncbi:hypothetical protein [Ruegeria sp. HKCCD7221]|uniref:hypothetical protein n=1 Tax=Ruegeria sp. HKCCD7221 TaxID=2683009 RepID=UPI001488B55A|nr:hypothetical protein [Ruegeria sp. HKCCD7221]
MARKSLDCDPPSPEELRVAAAMVHALNDPHDRPRLELVVRDLLRGQIDHRAYRALLQALLVHA